MIWICYRKANAAREQNQMNPISINIKYYGNYTIKIKDKVHYKAIKEVVWIVDVEQEEYNYTKGKFKNEIDFLDLNARVTFPRGVNTVMLKYCYGFNPIGIRDNIINEGAIERDCL